MAESPAHESPADLLLPLANAAMLTVVKGYALGPDRYHEASALMDAGNAALVAANKAKQSIRAAQRPPAGH